VGVLARATNSVFFASICRLLWTRRNSMTTSSPISPPKKEPSPMPVLALGDRKNGVSRSLGLSSIQTLSSFCQRVSRPSIWCASLITSAKGRRPLAAAAAAAAAALALGAEATVDGAGAALASEATGAIACKPVSVPLAAACDGPLGTLAHPASRAISNGEAKCAWPARGEVVCFMGTAKVQRDDSKHRSCRPSRPDSGPAS
jgi:hypothetical protein